MGGLLILGLGNVICGDDGAGVAAVARLAREHHLPEGVRALDGGTLGLALLSCASEASELLIVDAVRVDQPPGTLLRLTGEAVAPAVRERLSVHQIGVADLLDGLRLLGAEPRRMVLVGVVPESLELGLGLSPPVASRMGELVAAVAAEAGELGYPLPRRGPHETLPPEYAPERAHRVLGL